MRLGRIALVTGKPILRISFIVLLHDAVPRHFGQDAGRSDAHALHVALDQRFNGKGAGRQRHGIAQHTVLVREMIDDLLHRFLGRPIDVLFVNDLRLHDHDMGLYGLRQDLIIQTLARFLAQLLGIIDLLMGIMRGKAYAGHDQRSGDRPSAGLIQADDISLSFIPPCALMRMLNLHPDAPSSRRRSCRRGSPAGKR